MSPVDVKSNTYIDFNKENNEADPKFQAGDHIKKQKHFCKSLDSKLI